MMDESGGWLVVKGKPIIIRASEKNQKYIFHIKSILVFLWQFLLHRKNVK